MFNWFKKRKNKEKEEERKPKQDYASLLEQLAREGEDSKSLVWLLLGSLVSADTLTSVEACENSINMLTNLSEAITRVPEGLYTSEEISNIQKHCTDGIEICKTDLKTLESNEGSNKE